MPDIWEVFGVNALDIWELEVNDFFAMANEIDRMRREAKKPNGN
jgi:hypothetical protein